MGFACGSDDYAAMMVGNTLFGGSSNSKLFLNVREKLSLCYYASSAYHRQKRLITVSSGIEFQNYQKPMTRSWPSWPPCRLAAWRTGSWRAPQYAAECLRLHGRFPGKLENFYLARRPPDRRTRPELLAEQVRHVTAERIFDAMQTASLDTVYFLKGKETAE